MLGFCRIAGALVLLLGLGACGTLDPFETGTPDSTIKKITPDATLSAEAASAPARSATPPTRATPGPSTGMSSVQDAAATAGAIDPSSVPVSVCYSRLSSTPQKVIAIAAEQCGPDKPPSLVEQKWDLHSCPVMTPIRATFVCGAH